MSLADLRHVVSSSAAAALTFALRSTVHGGSRSRHLYSRGILSDAESRRAHSWKVLDCDRAADALHRPGTQYEPPIRCRGRQDRLGTGPVSGQNGKQLTERRQRLAGVTHPDEQMVPQVAVGGAIGP